MQNWCMAFLKSQKATLWSTSRLISQIIYLCMDVRTVWEMHRSIFIYWQLPLFAFWALSAPTTALCSTFLKPLQITHTHTLQHVSAVLLLAGSSGSMGPRCDSDSSCLCMMWSSPAPKRNALRTPDEVMQARWRAAPGAAAERVLSSRTASRRE